MVGVGRKKYRGLECTDGSDEQRCWRGGGVLDRCGGEKNVEKKQNA